MPIILQVTAWTILAVGLLALGHKFFPNLKQWFSTGNVSYVWVIAITLGLFVLLTYPYFFNWWAVNFWNVPEGELTDLTKLGPLGDIYGSLNTIFTSATLAFVVYATLLQRQANKDAREAMAEQLQHAQESTTQQLALAQASHDAQISESRYAIFSNMFYAFLNQKNEILRRICIGEEYEVNPNLLFEHISESFIDVITEKYNEKSLLEEGVEDSLYGDFCEAIISFSEKSINTNVVYGYFYTYLTLLELISRSSIQKRDKSFFRSIVSNSMSHDEQMCLLWMTTFTGELRKELYETNFFDADIDNLLMPFIVKNIDVSNFSNSLVLEKWKTFKETPA